MKEYKRDILNIFIVIKKSWLITLNLTQIKRQTASKLILTNWNALISDKTHPILP